MTELPTNNDEAARGGPDARRRERRGRTGLHLPGLVIMAVGVVLLLDNLDWVEAGQILRFWPVLLIGFGAKRLFGARDRGDAAVGTVLAGLGGVLLLNGLDVLYLDVRRLWPLLLIVVGFLMLTRYRSDARTPVDGAETCVAILGGVERRIHAANFRGGSATAFMGSVELDLTEANMADDEAVLHAFAMWGSVEIRIPDTWAVETRLLPIMGGVEDKTRKGPAEPTKRLVVDGTVLMAGMEIRN